MAAKRAIIVCTACCQTFGRSGCINIYTGCKFSCTSPQLLPVATSASTHATRWSSLSRPGACSWHIAVDVINNRRVDVVAGHKDRFCNRVCGDSTLSLITRETSGIHVAQALGTCKAFIQTAFEIVHIEGESLQDAQSPSCSTYKGSID